MNFMEAYNDIREENTRLRAINAELVAALEWIAEDGATDARATECARAAIAKAKP